MATLYIDKQKRGIYHDVARTKPATIAELIPAAGGQISLVFSAFTGAGPSTLASPVINISSTDKPKYGTFTLRYNSVSLGAFDISTISAASLQAYLNASADLETDGFCDVAPNDANSWTITCRTVGARDTLEVSTTDLVPFGQVSIDSIQTGDADERQVWTLRLEYGVIARQDTWTQSSAVAATITEVVAGSSTVCEVQRIAISGTPISGFWTITTASGVTAPLAFNASAAAVEGALNTKLGAGTVKVSKSADFTYLVAWTAVGSVAALTVETSGITGIQTSTAILDLDTAQAAALPAETLCNLQILEGTEVLHEEQFFMHRLNNAGSTSEVGLAHFVRYDAAQSLTSGEATQARTNITAAKSGAVTGSGLTMTTARLLGRSTASTGAIEEITLGTGLSFSGTTLNATASVTTSTGGNGATDSGKVLEFAGDGSIAATAYLYLQGTEGILSLANDSNSLGLGFAPTDINNHTGLLTCVQPLDQNTTWTLPNASGTVALTSNLSAYLPLTGGTLTGTLAIGGGTTAPDYFNLVLHPGYGTITASRNTLGSTESATFSPILIRLSSSVDSKGLELSRGSVEIVNASGYGALLQATALSADRTLELPNLAGTLMVGANNLSEVSSASTARTNLGLTDIATTTPGTGVATFLATPSSANLAAALTDETGTGAAVFANSPSLVTPVLGTPASGTLTNCTGLPATGIGSGYISDDRIFPLRPSSFAGTYDDDFTGSGLDAKWSRQGLVSGNHTYQTGNGSWMSMAIAAGTTGSVARSIYQDWTPADSTITCRLAYQQIGTASPMIGPFIVDSSGNGVGVSLYNNGPGLVLAVLAGWVYSSSEAFINLNYLHAFNAATTAGGLWYKLRKSGTTYYASVSYDGLFWGPEVSFVNATTMSRIGMGTFFRFVGAGWTDYGGLQHFDFFKVD